MNFLQIKAGPLIWTDLKWSFVNLRALYLSLKFIRYVLSNIYYSILTLEWKTLKSLVVRFVANWLINEREWKRGPLQLAFFVNNSVVIVTNMNWKEQLQTGAKQKPFKIKLRLVLKSRNCCWYLQRNDDDFQRKDELAQFKQQLFYSNWFYFISFHFIS